MSVRIINNVDVIAFVYHGALTGKLDDERTGRLPSDAGYALSVIRLAGGADGPVRGAAAAHVERQAH